MKILHTLLAALSSDLHSCKINTKTGRRVIRQSDLAFPVVHALHFNIWLLFITAGCSLGKMPMGRAVMELNELNRLNVLLQSDKSIIVH